jgi:hypothetical protein
MVLHAAADIARLRPSGALHALACVLLLLPAASSSAQSSAYAYRQRGAGDSLWYEGIANEPRAGSLSLLSFTIGRLGAANPAAVDGRLQVRFFSPSQVNARITVRELQSVKSYQLDADRRWRPAWNLFAWPTSAVIQPVAVDVRNLGVVVTSHPGISGTVFPALFADPRPGARISGYTVVVRSKYTCAPLVAMLFHAVSEQSQPIATQSHRGVAARAPKVLYVDATTLPEGAYTLRMSCEREGRGAGGGEDIVQRVFYDFYHVPLIPSGLRGDAPDK